MEPVRKVLPKVSRLTSLGSRRVIFFVALRVLVQAWLGAAHNHALGRASVVGDR